MSKLTFSLGKAIFEDKKFTNKFFANTLKKITKNKKEFSGFIRVYKPDEHDFFLFFLKSTFYAAGEISRSRPINISIREFFAKVSSYADDHLLVSLHETDPVLLKGLLVFIQKEPTIKAATNLIVIENIMDQIKKKNEDAFIVLNKNSLLNFFFFKEGEAIISLFSDTKFKEDMSSSISENLLLYAYPNDTTTVEAFIYRDIATAPAEDSEIINIEDVIKIIHKTETENISARSGTEQKKLYLQFFITEGKQTGEKFNVNSPCVIGRKACDVTIKDSKVSKKHARIHESESKIIIEDLDSTNGTLVNGKKITTKELQPGDVISLGNTKIMISFYWDISGYMEFSSEEQ